MSIRIYDACNCATEDCTSNHNSFYLYECLNATMDLSETFLGGFYSIHAPNYYSKADQCPPHFIGYIVISSNVTMCINYCYDV